MPKTSKTADETTTAAYAKALPKVGAKTLIPGDVVNIYRANWTVTAVERVSAYTIKVSLRRVSDGRTDSANAQGATRFGLVSQVQPAAAV